MFKFLKGWGAGDAVVVQTMLELKMTGNCLKGSRPLLSFDTVCGYGAMLPGAATGYCKSKLLYNSCFVLIIYIALSCHYCTVMDTKYASD